MSAPASRSVVAQRVAAEQHGHRVGGAAVDAAGVDRRAAREQQRDDGRRSIAPDRPVQRGLAAAVRLRRIGAGVEQQRRAGDVLAIEHVLQDVFADARPRREQHAQALEIGVLGRVIDRFVVVDPRAGVDEQAGEGRIVVVAGRAVETRKRVARIPRRLEGGVGIGAAGEQPPRGVEEGRRARRVALGVAREAHVVERRHPQRAARRVERERPVVEGALHRRRVAEDERVERAGRRQRGRLLQQGVRLRAILGRDVEELAGHPRRIAQRRVAPSAARPSRAGRGDRGARR